MFRRSRPYIQHDRKRHRPSRATATATAIVVSSMAAGLLAGPPFAAASPAPRAGLALHWSAPKLFDSTGGSPSGVSCPTKKFCVAVDSADNVFTYHADKWSSPRSLGSGQLSGVSCPTTSFCMAVGVAASEPQAYVLHHGTWTATSTVSDGPDARFNAVSCPSAKLCIAVGQFFQSPGNATLAETYSGGTWTLDSSATVGAYVGAELYGVSCATTAYCVAVGFYVTHDAPVPWYSLQETLSAGTWTNSLIYNGDVSMSAVSCRTKHAVTTCRATADAGDAFGFTTTGGWTGPTNIDASLSLNSVSCASSSHCVAVDASGNALTLASGAWGSPTSIDSGHSLTAVSCPSTGFCVAVDNRGDALVG